MAGAEMGNKMGTENEYGADQIQILEGLEAVRKRPGMYIGSTSARGLHHLVYEIVDNAVDEALAGYCKNIEVTINPDNSITVEDDGRGIPVGMNHKAGKSALEVVYTVLHAGGKFGGGGYKVSGGLHGVGASVVNALSTKLSVEVYKDGQIYSQSYKIGKPDEPVKVIGKCSAEKHGTKVTFHPDPTIFEETVYDYDTLKQRLRETAFLTKGLRIVLSDARVDPVHTHEFHYAGGIKEFVTYLNKSKEALYPEVIYCEGTRDGVYVEVAMQHNDSYNDATYSFVNNIITPEGGTHLAGFRNALTKTFNTYARANKILKDTEPALTGDDIREGLTAIISIKIEEPQFEGQTKQKLGNSEARGAVDSVVSEQLTYFLEQNPGVAKIISEKSILAQRARAAARRARRRIILSLYFSTVYLSICNTSIFISADIWSMDTFSPFIQKAAPGCIFSRGPVSPARQAGLLLVAQRPHHGIHLVVDMLSCDPGCQILVSRGDRLNDRSMFFQKLGIAFLLFQILDPVPVHLLPKIVQKLNEPAVVRRREDHVVERHVRLRDLRNIVAVKDISEMLCRRSQFPYSFLIDTVAGELNSQLLQGTSDFQHIP